VPAQPETEKTSWDFPIAGGFSGEIEREWAFETPMLIGVEEDGVSGPMKLNGKYVIPGATLRGAMRAAMGIVCRSRLTQVNINHKYGVRDFDHPLFNRGKRTEKDPLAWPNLGAGWLQKKPASDEQRAERLSDYVLTPCDKKLIRIRALPKRLNGRNDTNTGLWHLEWLTTKLADRYQKAGNSERGPTGKAVFLFGEEQKRSFIALPDENGDHYVIEGTGPDSMQGWLVFSDRLGTIKTLDRLSRADRDELVRKLDEQDLAKPGSSGFFKKRECVFLDRPGAKEVRLTQEVFEKFERINSKPGKTALKPDGSYAVLQPTLTANLRLPVFYVGDLGDQKSGLDIGLTRLFKLSHENGVGDVLLRQKAHKPIRGKPDMVEALFGFVYDRFDLGIPKDDRLVPGDVARKGRIAFGFANLMKESSEKTTGVITTAAMTPRASYAPFYLRGPIKDWTDQSSDGRRNGEARLAGRKRYFPRFPVSSVGEAAESIRATLSERYDTRNQDMKSELKFLGSSNPGIDLIFSGVIQLHNVTAEEIGALLWVLTHGGDSTKPYRHMIGRAKNAGAGQMRVKSLKLKLSAHPGKASRKGLLTSTEPWETRGIDGGWTNADSQSLGPFLREFEKYMRRFDRNWPLVDDIREFLGVSDPRKGAELHANGDAKFLTLQEFGRLRGSVKADIRHDPAPVSKANDRLLPAPSIEHFETPYAL